MAVTITEEELNRIQGLIHYLNTSFTNTDIDVEIQIGDSNGDQVGQIAYGVEGVMAYVFVPGGE